MKNRVLTFLGLIFLYASPLMAVPAYRGWITMTQPDGTEIVVRQMGDEFYHYYENQQYEVVAKNEQGFWVVVEQQFSTDTIAARRAKSPMKQPTTPMRVGTINLAPRGLVILVNFADKSFQSSNNNSGMNEMLNGMNYTYQGAYGSAKKYFSDQSNGAYVPTFDVVGPVTLNSTCSYYGGNDSDGDDLHPVDMVVEACQLANSLYNVDFTRYDNDNDGYVDFVYVIYAGKGEADGGGENTIWPHSWGVYSGENTEYTTNDITLDGKELWKYACSGEQNGRTGARCGIGTFVHEFSHVLGLPDFYDTNYSANAYFGLTPGDWEVMDHGNYNGDSKFPPNYSPWEKYFFGWATPNVLKYSGDIVMTSGYNDFYQLNSNQMLAPWNNTNTQYFFANRQQSGWDTYLPGHGLICWQVEYNQSAWNSNTPNNTALSPRYTIVAASGAPTVSNSQNDPYPGNANIQTCSVISSHPLSNIIENSDETVSFHYTGSNLSGSCGTTLQWSLDPYTGVLNITGSGAMSNYTSGTAPWYIYKDKITTINLPQELTSIGNFAFRECSGITSVTIPNGVVNIGNSAYYACSQLNTISIPNSVTSIGTDAFYSTALSSISIPNSVTSIGNHAFNACSNLTSVNLPSSLTSINSNTFKNCTSLASVTIPEGVTSIGIWAFGWCSSLTSLTIPSTVTEINNAAFRQCTSLNYIICKAQNPPTCTRSSPSLGAVDYQFFGVPKNIPVYVPAGSISAYQTATEWESFTNIQPLLENNVIIYTADAQINVSASSFNASITNHTFSNGLGIITFSADVTSIGDRAFTNCVGLTSITIPNSVTRIGDGAFWQCEGLSSITIPNSVTSIGVDVFSGCSGLSSIHIESGNPIYDSRDNCNAIIETSSNKLVCGCKSTVIPNSVTNIGNDAFRYCSGLTSITIPNSVTRIGSYAFNRCSDLTSINIPNGVTSIGADAFDGCSGLTSIIIPNSVTSIGNAAFARCSGLERIEVESGNTYYDCRDNCNAIIETASNTLISGCKNTTIPNNVTTIGDFAFDGCSGLTSITIPNSVTSIGFRGFGDCFNLTSITCDAINPPTCGRVCFDNVPEYIPLYVPQGSVSAYQAADGWSEFTNIQSISSISYTANAQLNIQSDWFDAPIMSHTFSDGIGTITFSETLTSIGDGAFGECSGLTSITIPNSVTTIGDEAFFECYGLTAFTLPNSVTSIGRVAFALCSGLERIEVECGNPVYDSRDNCNAIIETASNTLINGCKNTTIPNGMTSIGDYAFFGCSDLASIIIPNSVTYIGASALTGCSGLTSITIPNSVTYIGASALASCVGLTSITIPNSVTYIGASAFYGCSGLTSITIPNGVTNIGNMAFIRCSGLTSITIPNSVSSIGEAAFAYCPELERIEVESGNTYYDSRDNCNAIIETASNTLISGCKNSTIPNGVTTIGDEAFLACSGLTSITIPGSVTNIRSAAFADCSALSSITCEAVTPPTCDDNYCFYGVSRYIPVYVIESSVDDYKASSGWNYFANIINIPEVIFRNYDGSALWGETIHMGQIPVYEGATPTRPATAQYSYTFKGWSSNVITDPIVDLRDGEWEIFDMDEDYIYYRSTNVGISNSYYQMQIKWQGVDDFTFFYRSYAESTYDYLVVNGVDRGMFTSLPSDSDEGVAAHTSGNQSEDTYNVATINCSTDEHSIWICYRKDGSVNKNADRGYVIIPRKSSIVHLDEIVPVFGNVTYYAQYDSVVNRYTIHCDGDNCTFTGLGTYDYGSRVTVTAIPNDGYTFVSWSDGVRTPTRQITVTGNMNLTANVECETSTDVSHMQNVVYINDAIAARGGEVVLSVQMNNQLLVYGYQFQLVLPNGAHFVMDGDSYKATQTETRTSNSKHTFVTHVQDNVMTVLCYSIMKTFSGNSGEVAQIHVAFDDDIDLGNYPIVIRELEISHQDQMMTSISRLVSVVSVRDYILGDANLDGRVNVGDITTVATYILGTTPTVFSYEAADANQDGHVNVGDITAIASMILRGLSAPNRTMTSDESMSAEYAFGSVSVGGMGEIVLPIRAQNSDNAFSGFQFSLTIPEGLTVKNVVLNESRAVDMVLDYDISSNNQLRVLAYNLYDTRVSGIDGTLISVVLEGDAEGFITLEDGVFANSHQVCYAPTITTKVNISTEIEQHVEASSADKWYDILGRRIYDTNSNAQIYITNGKKIIK